MQTEVDTRSNLFCAFYLSPVAMKEKIPKKQFTHLWIINWWFEQQSLFCITWMTIILWNRGRWCHGCCLATPTPITECGYFMMVATEVVYLPSVTFLPFAFDEAWYYIKVWFSQEKIMVTLGRFRQRCLLGIFENLLILHSKY